MCSLVCACVSVCVCVCVFVCDAVSLFSRSSVRVGQMYHHQWRVFCPCARCPAIYVYIFFCCSTLYVITCLCVCACAASCVRVCLCMCSCLSVMHCDAVSLFRSSAREGQVYYHRWRVFCPCARCPAICIHLDMCPHNVCACVDAARVRRCRGTVERCCMPTPPLYF